MTFRLLNALSDFFKSNPAKEICLMDYDDDGWYTLYSFGVDDSIEDVESHLREYPAADLFVFDGNAYTEFMSRGGK